MRFNKLAGITLDVDVKDGTTTVSRVVPGKGYGHVAETTPYHAYWPTTLTVTSSLNNAGQLQFRQGTNWSCVMHFQPMDPAKQKSELLQCNTPKIRSQEQITVSVNDSSATAQPSAQTDVITIV